MSKTIRYQGREVSLIEEIDYHNQKVNNVAYMGLVLCSNGSLKYVTSEFGLLGERTGSFIVPTTVVAYNEVVVNDLELAQEAKRILEAKWYPTGSKANWFYGLGALGLENTSGTFRWTNGVSKGNQFSPKYYASAWRGGTKARITTRFVSGLGKNLGVTSIGIGLFLDGYGVYNYYNDPYSQNSVHPLKAASNFGISLYGIYNPAFSIPYFFIDSFYPGGWPSALDDMDRMEKDNQKVVPNFKLVPKPAW